MKKLQNWVAPVAASLSAVAIPPDPVAASLRAVAIPLAAFGLGAMVPGPIAATPAAAQFGSNDFTEAPEEAWPVGKSKFGEKWNVARVEQRCFVSANDATNNATAQKAFILAAGGNKNAPWDAIMIIDPRLFPLVQQGNVAEAQMWLNDQPVPLLTTIIFRPESASSETAMTVAVYPSGISTVFNGQPVNVRFSAKGLTLDGVIDPDRDDLARWRECTTVARQ